MEQKKRIINKEAAVEEFGRHRRAIFDFVMFAVVALIIYLIRGNIAQVIAPFVYALVLAYLFDPLIKLLEKKKLRRIFGIILLFLGIIGVLAIVLALFVPRLVRDAAGLAEDIPNMIKFVVKTAEEIRDGRLTIIPEPVLGWIDIDKEMANLADMVKHALGDFSSWLLASSSKLLDLVMTPIITFYYLKDKDRLVKNLLQPFKGSARTDLISFAGEVDKVLGSFIRGQLLVAAFVGVLTGIGCAIIGVPHALTIGLVAGFTNIIPYFGPWIGGILPVVLALMDRPISALWVIILIVVVQQVESSFMSPQIMSHSVGMHPLLVMFSVLLFGSIMGIPGMILGVPIMATIKILWTYVVKYRQRYENRKLKA